MKIKALVKDPGGIGNRCRNSKLIAGPIEPAYERSWRKGRETCWLRMIGNDHESGGCLCQGKSANPQPVRPARTSAPRWFLAWHPGQPTHRPGLVAVDNRCHRR